MCRPVGASRSPTTKIDAARADGNPAEAKLESYSFMFSDFLSLCSFFVWAIFIVMFVFLLLNNYFLSEFKLESVRQSNIDFWRSCSSSLTSHTTSIFIRCYYLVSLFSFCSGCQKTSRAKRASCMAAVAMQGSAHQHLPFHFVPSSLHSTCSRTRTRVSGVCAHVYAHVHV